MASKAARGTKRTCQNDDCASRFYDLNRDPIVCPICDTEYVLATAPPPEPEPEPVKEEPKEKPAEEASAKGDDALDAAESIEDIEDSDDVDSDDDNNTFLATDDDQDDTVVPEIIVGSTKKGAGDET